MENVAQSGSTELKDIFMEIKTKENNTKKIYMFWLINDDVRSYKNNNKKSFKVLCLRHLIN